MRGDRSRFQALIEAGVRIVNWENARELRRNTRLLHSIPTLAPGETDALHELIRALAPSRVVYISSTGVYGAAETVDETTPAVPDDERGRLRLAEEEWVRQGWSSLVLRAAAIYGPGRGVHAAVREGRAPRGAGSSVASRIHVDDLAALADAALLADDLEGAWPVADDLPCSSAEIVAWCTGGAPVPESLTTIRGRRVDGRKIRELLGVELRYPSWKTGVAAALEEEAGG